MEAAPRPWQFSLPNWSVTRKVGIVLVLPVVLATVFAVLRINNELQTMDQLDAATEQAIIIRPIVKFGTATEHLAVTATSSWGNTADPRTDAALTRFDQALADMETALQDTGVSSKVTAELSSAVAIGTTMRNSLRSGSPAMVGDQADEIGMRISNALALSPSVEDLVIQRYFLQLTTIQTARRVLTEQRMLISSPDAARNPSMRARVLTSAGAELTMIYQYGQILPELAGNMRPLLDAVQTRLATFSQNTADPASNPAVLDSLQISADTYDATTAQLTDVIDAALLDRTTEAQNSALRETTIVIAVLLAGLALALAVARTLVVPVRRLRRDALEVAHVKLPDELSVVRAGGTTPKITPVAVHTTDEIGQLARAVDEMHEQALNLAAEQARLRVQIGNMFETLSRRSQSLVEQQLALIETLEHDEENSERLQSLFRLDHLATRMRRNGDNLLVLAGTALRRGQLQPVPLSDMLWSAVSQVEDYQRVEIGTVPDGIVAGEPAVDIEHLLAELIDNALRYSPPTTPVAVTVSRAVDGGYLIEITDRGLGMSAEDLQATNERLASGGEVTIETARRMGLFVVGRLAKRHTITVSLRRTSTMAQQPGITASVHLPGALVAPAMDEDGVPGGKPATDPFAALPPGAPPQRALVSVPNLPEAPPQAPAESVPVPPMSTWGTTSSGLPQRRPSMRVAEPPEQPSISVPASARPESGSESTNGRTDAEERSDATPFGPPTPEPHPGDADTGPNRIVTAEPDEEPTGLWAETAEHPIVTPQAEPEPRTTTAGSGLPIRRPGAARDEPQVPEAPPAPQPDRAPQPVPAPQAPETVTVTAESAAATSTSTRLQPVGGDSPTPIYQRMVSEWLVEPATAQPSSSTWSSPADAGWMAAEDASKPTTSARTVGGLPIRRPGAQLVPGGLAPAEEAGARDPEEIRNNLTRHLSGVRSGRADAQHNDGGLA
ncbi:HAMP domain-containing protein [Nocardia cyriacigeorgica]|uniref:histidine kinase n=1 Tax=Nocardia cyriacigeorgica TaxID=135487 RepID=A0A6P1D5X0_9NOCA|nr:ATP-binding protein [Nocardia cyriacigeorgica]NEW41377.1 HAMP domain-containing protein [Nocardia cyriacigeorgica]NEW45448.1 HAMP domain-containing protein [Nocardia cyriacigeorgica]NEW52899.1 HAMP domain-containing protein [Nocardia cyriacigeorgica]NEW57446.1 HAMP domain-containing protein [Nocardia cyriacigeorgica]